MRAGLNLMEIQNLLGHASPITSLRYAHLAADQAASKAVVVLEYDLNRRAVRKNKIKAD